MSVPGFDAVKSGLGALADGVSDGVADFVNSSSGFTREAVNGVGFVTGTDPADWAHRRDIQEQGNDRRDDLYAEREREQSQFRGQYDAPAPIAMENFDAMSHAAMKDGIDSTDPASLAADAQAWSSAGDRINATVTAFNDQIKSAITGGWEGTAAEQAKATVATYAQETGQLEVAARLVGNKISEAQSGIEQAKLRMPPPEQTSPADVVRGFLFGGHFGRVMDVFHKSEEARQQAVQVMKTEYAPVVMQASAQIPVLPEPYNPTHGDTSLPQWNFGAPGGPPDTGGWPQTGPRPGIDASPGMGSPRIGGSPGVDGLAGRPGPGDGTVPTVNTGTGPGVSGGPGQFDGGTEESPLDGAGGPAPASALPGVPSLDSPTPLADLPSTDATRAASAGAPLSGAGIGSGASHGLGADAPGASGSGASGGPDGTGIGRAGGGSAGLAGRGLDGAVSLAAPSLGGVAATGAGPAGAAASAGAAGRPGAPGAGGMAPHGSRGKGDDDKEHNTPGYLVSTDNGNELIGGLRKVAPPVIGA